MSRVALLVRLCLLPGMGLLVHEPRRLRVSLALLPGFSFLRHEFELRFVRHQKNVPFGGLTNPFGDVLY
jgi:hypothetical protein